MTELLEQAFEGAPKLPHMEQDSLARALLDELASERRWDEFFATSNDLLGELAPESLAEHRSGSLE